MVKAVSLRLLLAGLTAMLVLAVTGPPAASAQVLTTVEFSFSNPGARSLGFGGAFVALADDATAAFSNPAGLVQLTEPEISIEARSWRYVSPYTSGGRAAGEPTGFGIDTIAGPLRAESEADLAGFSFVSLVYPAGRWSLAFYQHQLMNFEMTEEIQGLFGPGPGVEGTLRGPIERGFFDFEITNRALAAGYRITDNFSLGFGLSYFDPATSFGAGEFLPDDDSAESFFASASFLPSRLSHDIEAGIPGGDWGLTCGLLWSVSPSWKLGGVYREGPKMGLEGTLTAGPVHPELAPGQSVFGGASPWHFPDVYGAGASYRSRNGHWTAAFEWNRVEYSTFLDSLAPELSSGDRIDDADELHLGGEYAFFVGTSVAAARLGVWHDPDHLVHNDSGSVFIRAESVPGDDEFHVAAGIGVAHERFQIDLGVDFSARRDTASLSAIYSF